MLFGLRNVAIENSFSTKNERQRQYDFLFRDNMPQTIFSEKDKDLNESFSRFPPDRWTIKDNFKRNEHISYFYDRPSKILKIFECDAHMPFFLLVYIINTCMENLGLLPKQQVTTRNMPVWCIFWLMVQIGEYDGGTIFTSIWKLNRMEAMKHDFRVQSLKT